jgi:hypothetical protein
MLSENKINERVVTLACQSDGGGDEKDRAHGEFP